MLTFVARLNISYPMLFELKNNRKEKTSHAGVLEFIAEEGRIYIPHWVSVSLNQALLSFVMNAADSWTR